MEAPAIAIKNSILKLLKSLDPEIDVFFEEIRGTDEGHGLSTEDSWYFLSLIPSGMETVDACYTDQNYLVDIAYHEKSESNTRYLIKFVELDALFRPVFSFGDRKITVEEATEKVVDHVLHYSFSLRFRHSEEKEESYPAMEELETEIKKEE